MVTVDRYREKLPQNYFQLQIFLLRWNGLELKREESFAYSIVSKFSIFFYTYLYIAVEGYEIYMSWDQIYAHSNVLICLSIHLMGEITKNFLLYNSEYQYKILQVV